MEASCGLSIVASSQMVAISTNLNISIVGGTHSTLNLVFKEIMVKLESKSLLLVPFISLNGIETIIN